VDGKSTLRSLIGQHGALPPTLITITCHGTQYLFKYPAGRTIRNENAGKKLGDGLDIRGDGGYVMVPPSIHPEGIAYRFDDVDVEIADAPEGLVATAASPGPCTTPPATNDLIPKGKGEPMKFVLAARMFKAGCTELEVLDAELALDKRCEHRGRRGNSPQGSGLV
jgi:hypothetical protein